MDYAMEETYRPMIYKPLILKHATIRENKMSDSRNTWVSSIL